jgi:hypothetical protein
MRSSAFITHHIYWLIDRPSVGDTCLPTQPRIFQLNHIRSRYRVGPPVHWNRKGRRATGATATGAPVRHTIGPSASPYPRKAVLHITRASAGARSPPAPNPSIPLFHSSPRPVSSYGLTIYSSYTPKDHLIITPRPFASPQSSHPPPKPTGRSGPLGLTDTIKIGIASLIPQLCALHRVLGEKIEGIREDHCL